MKLFSLLPLSATVAMLVLAMSLAGPALAEPAAEEAKEKQAETQKAAATDASDTPAAKKLDEKKASENKPNSKKASSDNKASNESSKDKTSAKKPTNSVKKPAKKRRIAKKTTKKKTPPKVRYANLVLSGALPEVVGEVGPFGDLKNDLRKVLARFEKAAADSRVEGIVLDLRSPAIGRGTAHELREAILKFRKSGKKVHAQLEIASPSDYLVACACDEIVMPESGFLLLPGVRAEPMFYKGMLSKLGVKADFLHMGEAKGAGESYTRKKWSKPVKENITAMIDDVYEQMVETLVRDRPVTDAQAREAIDLGLLTASDARERGLIDRVAYPDELRRVIGESHPDKRLTYLQNYGAKKVDTDFSGPAGFFKLMGMMAGGKPSRSRSSDKKIAVIYAVGPIMTGKSEQDLFGSSTLGSTTVVAALDKANRDDSIAAIVLRVNSPGGSAVASDLIWRKTQQLDKPFVASMGDVAASGGYYISMGADQIFCEPGGVTGSIGVVAGKFALRGMYNKLGLTTDLISRGENSGLFSGTRKWNASERAAMMRMMEDTYDQFTSKAAKGRGMPVEQLKKLAGGKVYTGIQAKANGLVDETGTLDDAVAAAKKLAGIAADKKVKTVVLPEPVEFFEAVFGNLDKEKEVRLSLDAIGLPKDLSRTVQRLHTWQRLLEREPVGVFMPFDLVIE